METINEPREDRLLDQRQCAFGEEVLTQFSGNVPTANEQNPSDCDCEDCD